MKITAHDCPRIPAAWLEQERTKIGDWWFQQEYLCEFLEAESQVFATHYVEAALSDEVRPLFSDWSGA